MRKREREKGIYLRTVAGSLRAIWRIAQAIDLAPIIDAGQHTEGRSTNALLIAATFTNVGSKRERKQIDYNA